MTNDELIAKFNPANAGNLTESDLEEMRALTNADLDVLASAYPNQPQRKPYLILYDTTVDPKKQMHQLSTWQNLRNVRKYSNKANFVPYTFRSIFEVTRNPTAAQRQNRTAPSTAKKVVVDLSPDEAKKRLDKAIQDRSQPVTSSDGGKGKPVVTGAKKPVPAAKKGVQTPAPAGKANAKAAAEKGDQEFTDGSGD